MISKLINENESYIIKLRRYFHKNPELSWKEYNTSEFIKKELSKMKIPYESAANTGIIAYIKGNNESKIVGLRADMDALNICEENEMSYKSINENIMHACGHDGHMAMLLGAGKILNQIKDRLNGSVKLIFQPAEELVEGAKKIIESKRLEDIDSILGIHLWADIETGKVNCDGGPRMASGDYIKATFYGNGGHGSLPNQCIDPTIMASKFILNIQSVVTREVNPLESLAFTFGKISCGSRFNVIPNMISLEGTVRCFNSNLRNSLPDIINRYGKSVARTFNGKFSLEYKKGTPPTINNNLCSKIARNSLEKFIEKKNIVSINKIMGSEDMAYYLRKVPGAIAFVGCKNIEKDSYPHHHPKFNINEKSLKIGTQLYVRYAIDFLNKNND